MEQFILNAAREFAREISRLEQIKPGSDAVIELAVSAPSALADNKTPRLVLECRFWDGENRGTVQAATLGALMDEIHRRLGFADKQAFAIEAAQRSLAALEAPKGWDSVES
jgi:hypothetical protein